MRTWLYIRTLVLKPFILMNLSILLNWICIILKSFILMNLGILLNWIYIILNHTVLISLISLLNLICISRWEDYLFFIYHWFTNNIISNQGFSIFEFLMWYITMLIRPIRLCIRGIIYCWVNCLFIIHRGISFPFFRLVWLIIYGLWSSSALCLTNYLFIKRKSIYSIVGRSRRNGTIERWILTSIVWLVQHSLFIHL